MAEFKLQRDTNRFFALGMDLNRPIDEIKDLKYALLKNVRSYETGIIEPRQGLTLVGTVTGPVHSIRRLNAPRTSDYTRVIGSGTVLNFGKTSFAQIDTGYSGNPLAMVPYRPPQSPDPWMYVMDSNKQRKLNVTGTLNQVGLPPPTTAPITMYTGAFHSKTILNTVPLDADIDAAGSSSSTAVWHGPRGNQKFATNFEVTPTDIVINTSITTIIYDSGTSGRCSIIPGNISGCSPNLLARVGGAENIVFNDVITGSAASDVIQSVTAIPGTTNYAVVLTALSNFAKLGGIIENTTHATVTKINAIITGTLEIQTLIVGSVASTWVAGDTIFLRNTIKTSTVATYTSSDSLVVREVRTEQNITNDPAVSLSGWWVSPRYSPALDLSMVTSTIPTTADSYISLQCKFDQPENNAGLRISFGCIDTGASWAGDSTEIAAFATDYFYADFTTDQVDGSNGISIKQSAFNKVGNPSWKNIIFFKLEYTLTPHALSTNPNSHFTKIAIHSCYFAGEPGPNSGTIGAGYIYRYRARVSTTGVVSNWGPVTLNSIIASGQSISLVIPAQYTLATEADKIDFQRRGGSLPDNWYYAGTVNNAASPVTFIDKTPDDVIIANPSDGQDFYQLWPVIGAPASGTGVTVNGIIVTGTGFSTSWAPNTAILINGIAYSIYQVYSSTVLQIMESAGVITGAVWEIPEPILAGQPFPCFWGPLDETMFGCGDPVNPQRLYWTNRGDADSTTLTNWIDITTPSEPLMNGVTYNGRCYVWSSERFFQILRTNTGWDYVEIPSGNGLWSRWAFTNPQSIPGKELIYLSRDGIYATDGGSPSDISAEDLKPLLPNEGNIGKTINTVNFPNMISGLEPKFRLSYYDDYLYFDYPSI